MTGTWSGVPSFAMHTAHTAHIGCELQAQPPVRGLAPASTATVNVLCRFYNRRRAHSWTNTAGARVPPSRALVAICRIAHVQHPGAKIRRTAPPLPRAQQLLPAVQATHRVQRGARPAAGPAASSAGGGATTATGGAVRRGLLQAHVLLRVHLA